MSIGFYMDHHVQAAVSQGLQTRGIDVLTAQADGHADRVDAELLDRALRLGRVVFTQDADFLALATKRRADGEPFATVVYGHQLRVSIGQTIADLELISGTLESVDLQNQVIYLPL